MIGLLLGGVRVAPSAEHGMDQRRLDALRTSLAEKRTDAFLVMHRGRIIYEWYAPDWNANKPHGTASLAKSLVGALSLLLVLDGVLYMWARNAGNAQLAWSSDRGTSWTWGWKLTDGFGSPTFLQRVVDGYVYTISQDGPSAYASDDGLALARVPQGRVPNREAWEFFRGLDAGGRPVWTDEIAKRGAVFRYPRRCRRAELVYNVGLRRYLLALGFDHASGWGIFDAPEPWGPWTTAFFTEEWDLAGTHGYRLPQKWMSSDGRTMWLVFSGTGVNDAFCVRRMTVSLLRR